MNTEFPLSLPCNERTASKKFYLLVVSCNRTVIIIDLVFYLVKEMVAHKNKKNAKFCFSYLKAQLLFLMCKKFLTFF